MEEKIITQKQLKKVPNWTQKQTRRKAIETVRGYKFQSIVRRSYESYRQSYRSDSCHIP